MRALTFASTDTQMEGSEELTPTHTLLQAALSHSVVWISRNRIVIYSPFHPLKTGSQKVWREAS